MVKGLINNLLAARRLGIKRNDFVLEIGSGSRPFLRSDVLLDISIKPFKRTGKLVMDRPLVIANAQYLPFKDKSFDFIIAAHILEHIEKPDKFINGIERVGKGGYMKTPSPIGETLIGHGFYLWYVYIKEETLIIAKKELLVTKGNNLMNYFLIHN